MQQRVHPLCDRSFAATRVSAALFGALLAATAAGARAQHSPAAPAERPVGAAPLIAPLPGPAPETPLPALRDKAGPASPIPAAVPRMLLRRVELIGNTVLDPAAISIIAGDYEGREIDSDELEDLRLRLTRRYIDSGHVNSGVTIPDQDMIDGVLRLHAVEGRLTEVEIEQKTPRLRRDYLESRLRIGAGRVLNLNTLRESIALLQQDGLVERIRAEIVPGLVAGEAQLRAQVEETESRQVGVTLNNQRNAAVGETRAELFAIQRNLTGRGDRIEARVGATRGIRDYSIAYSLPLNPRDTTLSVSHSSTDALVIDAALRALDISSRSRTDTLMIEHPLWRTMQASLKISLARERRHSQTRLLGVPFSFTPGVPDSGAAAGMWRLAASWLHRGAQNVLAARFQLTRGASNVESPKTSAAAPDAGFEVWLGQLHWGHRFFESGAQLIARMEFQESPRVLLSMERYGLGGANSVRGFRENQLLRDRGQLYSIEYRHPLLGRDRPEWQIAPFLDAGRGRSNDGTAAAPTGIAGAGVGVLWSPNRQVSLQLYAAKGSRRFPGSGSALQDRGIHLAATWSLY